MSPLHRITRRVDALQQRSRVLGFLYAVVKKFGDDRAGSLAALVAYYSFLSIFPLLLLVVTVLGFLLHDNPSLQHRLVDSALGDFPIVGDQIRANIGSVKASGFGLAVGLAGLLWGSLGMTQAAQFAMAQVWNVKADDQPGFVARVARGLWFLATLAGAAGVTALVGAFAVGDALWLEIVTVAVSAVANVGLYVLGFRALTPGTVAWRELLPGAAIAGVAWTVLQTVGAALVANQLRGTSQLYGLFAIVLGLLSWLYLTAQITLYAAEVNVVLARRLWPRSIAPPPLTESDRTVLRNIAQQAARRPEERIDVSFDRYAER